MDMTTSNFNSQVARLESLLLGFAMRLTGSKENAKDLMQETLMRAYASRGNFMEGTNFKAWVTTIMRNCFINDYRKKRTRNKVEQPLEENMMAAIQHPVRNLESTIIMMKELRNILDRICDGNRVPFEMFFKGFEYKEIAEQLDIPIGTVKSRIFFARKHLKEAIHGNYGKHVSYA